MSDKVLNRSDVVAGKRVKLPLDLYGVRVTKVTGRRNDKWNCEMTMVEIEVIDPEKKEIDGVETTVAGTKGSVCLMHEPNEEWGQSRIIAKFDQLGVDPAIVDDIEQFRNWLKTARFNWMLSGEEQFMTWPKNHPDREKAGKPVTTATGEKISQGYRINADVANIVEIL